MSDIWLGIIIFVSMMIVVDLLSASEMGDKPLALLLIKWLLVPLWGPGVLLFKYVDHRDKTKRHAIDVRVWLKAELIHNADIQHLAYKQGLIDNDWRLVRAGTYGEYDPVLEAVA